MIIESDPMYALLTFVYVFLWVSYCGHHPVEARRAYPVEARRAYPVEARRAYPVDIVLWITVQNLWIKPFNCGKLAQLFE